MKTLRKTTIATLAGLGILAAAAATPALSHGMGGQGYGQGYGPGYGMMGGGMMGPGAGYGGGRGFGPGMMGPGHGPGFGAGFGPCAQQAAASGNVEVTVDDVTQRMERWLAIQGNDRLKLGKVEAVDDDTITAEIVTVDGSLVQKFAIDRDTGRTRPAQ